MQVSTRKTPTKGATPMDTTLDDEVERLTNRYTQMMSDIEEAEIRDLCTEHDRQVKAHNTEALKGMGVPSSGYARLLKTFDMDRASGTVTYTSGFATSSTTYPWPMPDSGVTITHTTAGWVIDTAAASVSEATEAIKTELYGNGNGGFLPGMKCNFPEETAHDRIEKALRKREGKAA